MTEEEWEEHLNFLDNAEISPYPITVGGSHTRGYGTVVPYLYVDQEEREEYQMVTRCNACFGSGVNPQSATWSVCTVCTGSGEVVSPEKAWDEFADSLSNAASTLGRLGGLAKSEAKSTSSRVNGRKGGRPKSTQSINMEDI